MIWQPTGCLWSLEPRGRSCEGYVSPFPHPVIGLVNNPNPAARHGKKPLVPTSPGEINRMIWEERGHLLPTFLVTFSCLYFKQYRQLAKARKSSINLVIASLHLFLVIPILVTRTPFELRQVQLRTLLGSIRSGPRPKEAPAPVAVEGWRNFPGLPVGPRLEQREAKVREPSMREAAQQLSFGWRSRYHQDGMWGIFLDISDVVNSDWQLVHFYDGTCQAISSQSLCWKLTQTLLCSRNSFLCTKHPTQGSSHFCQGLFFMPKAQVPSMRNTWVWHRMIKMDKDDQHF